LVTLQTHNDTNYLVFVVQFKIGVSFFLFSIKSKDQ